LYFQGGDPLSVHTLTGAAYDVLRDVNRARGGHAMLKDWAPDFVKEEFRKDVQAKLNQAQNFLKHADRDPEATLEFDPGATELLLLDAAWAYRRLAGERPPILGVFEMWGFLTFASAFVTYEGIEDSDPAARTRLASLSRGAFFDEMAPVAFHPRVQSPDA
jgi:hypothetical protein